MEDKSHGYASREGLGTGSLAPVIAEVFAHGPYGVRTCSHALLACPPPPAPRLVPGKLVRGEQRSEPARCCRPHSQLSASQPSPKPKRRTSAAARARLSRELAGPPLHLPRLHGELGGSSGEPRRANATRQSCASAPQVRRRRHSAALPRPSAHIRLSGPMSRRALRRLRGEQRGQEPLGPDALQFVLLDDDDAEEEGPKPGLGGRRPGGAGKEGVRVNNRFELVRSWAT